MAFTRWTSAMKSVFQFVRKAVYGLIERETAIETITRGIPDISREEVSKLWDVAEYEPTKSEKLMDLPKTYVPSVELGTLVDWDLKQKYAMQVNVHFWSESRQEWMDMWVTAESDEPLAMVEWDMEAMAIVAELYPELEASDMAVIDYSYLVRAR